VRPGSLFRILLRRAAGDVIQTNDFAQNLELSEGVWRASANAEIAAAESAGRFRFIAPGARLGRHCGDLEVTFGKKA
jgi:hypothetical protein